MAKLFKLFALSVLLCCCFNVISGSHVFTYKGEQIVYHDKGKGAETLLFIHGLPLSSDSWACQVDYFKKHYRVIMIDLVGYGQSSPLKNPMMKHLSAFYAASIEALLNHLKIDKVDYIGFATGGHVGIKFAATYPQKLDKLVLINASPQFTKAQNWPYGFDKKTIDSFNVAFENKSITEIATLLLKPAMDEACHKSLTPIQKRFTEMTIDAGVNTLKAFFNNIAYENFRPLLGEIKADTLIIQSKMDKEVVPEVGLYMRAQIPNATLVEINRADHFVFATHKKLINRLIANFIKPHCQLCEYKHVTH